MPIGMISKFARSFAEARCSRGYQSSGVAILRPSTSVTTSSVAVNSTARGRKSPTSISKVLIPLNYPVEFRPSLFLGDGRHQQHRGDRAVVLHPMGGVLAGGERFARPVF